MAHYLVTGVAGFIAARVAEMLIDQGHTVLGIDYVPSEAGSLARYRLSRLDSRSEFSFHYCDITDREAMSDVLDGNRRFDGVLNLAARAGVRQSVADPWSYLRANVLGALNLLDLCKERGIRKFVLASTSSAYGVNDDLPYREDAAASRPISPYAASKKSAELFASSYHALHGLDVTILRYFTVYGPAGRPDMATFRFVQRIREGRPILVYGDGNQSRDFTYIDDVAEGTIAALRPLGYEVINLGGDKPHRLMDLIRLIEERFGRQAIIEYSDRHSADVQATWANIDKAKGILQWEPHTGLERGVDLTATWYESERSWARDIPTD